MNYTDFENLVTVRQACRSYNDQKVDKETVKKIAKLSRLAPSACNSQPWTMHCVTEEKTVSAVRAALTENDRNSFLSNVSAYIAVSEKAMPLKPDITKRFSDDFFVKYDIGQLLAYITLTAKSLGVESCIIGYVNEKKIKETLSLSDDESCRIVVALGYSDIPVREKIRRSEEDIIKEY